MPNEGGAAPSACGAGRGRGCSIDAGHLSCLNGGRSLWKDGRAPAAAEEARWVLERGRAGDFTFRWVVTNACGSVTSDPAVLSMCACLECPADFNQDGGIDGADVEFFFGRWERGC